MDDECRDCQRKKDCSENCQYHKDYWKESARQEANKDCQLMHDMSSKLAKLTYMAKCFIHTDKTCSLPAQGYSEIECAELATEDSMATEMLAIINGFESRYDKAEGIL